MRLKKKLQILPMMLIIKSFIIQNLIINLIILNISGVMAEIIHGWNVIILLMDYENMCHKLWLTLRVLLFWDVIIDVSGKCSYIEKVLYMVLQNG